MPVEESSLEIFKEKYGKLKKKYGLPEFELLNQNFEIENLCVEDIDLVLKKIRKVIMEKVYFNFVKLEAFLNPQNASIFVFNIIKGFDSTDKELINKLYKKFAEYEIESFGLEASYAEQKEADFIKRVGNEWPEIIKDLIKLYEAMKNSFDKAVKKQDKGYLG